MPRKWSVLIGIPLSAALFFLTSFAGSAAPTATITVNTTADTVVSDGKCSLREAIQAANTNAAVNECPAGATGIDSIVFSVGSGTPTINVTGTALPTITGSVSLNGNTGGATRVELNGTAAGAGAHGLTITAGKTTIRGLVINRFAGNGIEMVGGSFNIIVGNLIGTNAAGTSDLGNAGVGVHINTGTKHTIGGTTAADRNIISGNQNIGILMDASADQNSPPTDNTIRGNFVGTDSSGTTVLGNDSHGIIIIGGSNNTIGGTGGVTPGGSCTGSCNLVAGNSAAGVTVVRGSNNKVMGNFIGTDVTGMVDLGNTTYGVFLSEASSNTVGGTASGSRNLISGNNDDGILIIVGTGNLVAGNLIGTNTTGAATLANSGAGIKLDRTFNNTIGGTTAAARNVISGNTEDGIFLGTSATQTPSHDNTIQGNFIGVRLSGIGALANGQDGIDISRGSANLIGGTTGTTPGGACTGACNLITGNTLFGIRMRDGAANTTVQGNLIGLNAPGDSTPGGNIQGGIAILDTSHDTLVGGTDSHARNVISGNQGHGVEINGDGASENVVQGNFIGTPANGQGTMFNFKSGIHIRAANNTIGGTEAGAQNVISGNVEQGILLRGEGTTGNRIQGNFIGTDLSGALDLGNGEEGIEFSDDQPSGNQIGGTVSDAAPTGGNVIAFNNENGVRINGGNQDVVRFNSIFSNAAPEIDLSFGNNDQAAPVLTSATTGSTFIQGSLMSAPSTIFKLDFYYNPTCDHPQGKTYLGSAQVITFENGIANFTAHQATAAPIGSFITATATDPNNNTSEFSNCVQVVQGPTSTHTPTATRTLTPTATRTPTRTSTSTATPPIGCTSKPDKPSLKAPPDDAMLGTLRPRLKWFPATCADTYTVVVKNLTTGKKADKAAGLGKLKYKTKLLTAGHAYKWFVKACNTFGCSKKSVPRKFSTP